MEGIVQHGGSILPGAFEGTLVFALREIGQYRKVGEKESHDLPFVSTGLVCPCIANRMEGH